MTGRGAGVRERPVAYFLALLVIAALLSGAVLFQYAIDRGAAAGRGPGESSLSDTGRSILNVLGSVRQALAAYMWTRTDDLHHGYLGHSIENAVPMFPYFWLITRLDPNFTMAFYYASYMLYRLGQPGEGYRLSVEGLRHNPASPLLHRNMAEIYLFFEKDPERAMYHALKAKELSLVEDDDAFAALENLQSLIERVLAGEIKIPELSPWGDPEDHHHEHGEYCPDCER